MSANKTNLAFRPNDVYRQLNSSGSIAANGPDPAKTRPDRVLAKKSPALGPASSVSRSFSEIAPLSTTRADRRLGADRMIGLLDPGSSYVPEIQIDSIS